MNRDIHLPGMEEQLDHAERGREGGEEGGEGGEKKRGREGRERIRERRKGNSPVSVSHSLMCLS